MLSLFMKTKYNISDVNTQRNELNELMELFKSHHWEKRIPVPEPQPTSLSLSK